MKSMKYFYLVIFPIIVLAQQLDKKTITDFSGEFDWGINDRQGCVLAISSDSINFEERWMHLVPTGTQITSRDGSPIALQNLMTPFWAEVSYGAKGQTIYMKSVCFLSQFEYDANGYIIGAYKE